MKNHRRIILSLALVALLSMHACQCSCGKNCNNSNTEQFVWGSLVLEGDPGDCNYGLFVAAANGAQQVSWQVVPANPNTPSPGGLPQFSVQASTYPMQVPTGTAFTINVQVEEIDNQTCCTGTCPGGGFAKPKWKGSKQFPSAGPAGSAYQVTMVFDSCHCP